MIKEIIPPDEITEVLKSDFSESWRRGNCLDLDFLTKLKDGVEHKQDGHYAMPLPFKQDRPNLPDNKSFAIHCLKSLERKLQRGHKHYSDYVNFMEDIIARGDAEKAPDKELNNHPVWYIPHHRVYHPQKPGKIRVN